MKLRNNDTLDAVNHKSTVFGHERNFAHVNFLLFYIFDCLIRRIFVVNDQPHFNAQWNRVGDATQLTLFNVKCWFTQTITDVFEPSTA